jgi:hypothetical protein
VSPEGPVRNLQDPLPLEPLHELQRVLEGGGGINLEVPANHAFDNRGERRPAVGGFPQRGAELIQDLQA